MAVLDWVIVFVVSLLVGALAIYIGARVVVGVDDYGHAIVTALVGALAWLLLGWVPIIGPILALIAYLAIINWRYPGGWFKAIAITAVAWISALVVLWVLEIVGITAPDALGVPGA